MCICVRVCKNIIEDAKRNTKDTQREFYVLGEDRNFGHRGRAHYRTQPPSEDVLYIALDLLLMVVMTHKHLETWTVPLHGRYVRGCTVISKTSTVEGDYPPPPPTHTHWYKSRVDRVIM